MLFKFIKKYFSVIFITATLISVFHQHGDLKLHTDCQICVLQSSVENVDTPSETAYFTKLDIFQDNLSLTYTNSYYKTFIYSTQTRAPPSIV